jgi:HD superfamily phosphohydrolase YqeK
LLEHTIAVSLLSFEIGRLLHLEDPHNLSAAGAMHDIGKWFFAIGEPALYAATLALTLTQSEPLTIGKAETEIFGLSHPEAGDLLLKLGGASPLLREATRYHNTPEKVADRRLAPLVAAVYIADRIASAVQSADPKFIADTRTALAARTHPAWAIMRNSGVEPPLDIPELADAIFSIAETTAWTTGVLLKGS